MTEVYFTGHESGHLRRFISFPFQGNDIVPLVLAVHDVLQVISYEVDGFLVFGI